MYKLIAAIFVMSTLFAPFSAGAQDRSNHVGIATIDIEAIYLNSIVGKRKIAELEARQAALQAENDQIRDDLIAEEQSLTELRPTLDVEAFRKLAAEFDQRVQGIRRARDAAEQALTSDAQAAPNIFLTEVRDIMLEVMLARGADVIIDRRFVLLGTQDIDITAEVIARVDQEFGSE